MEIAITVLLLIVGLVLIIKGGDFFVDAASWMAEASGIPKLIVGATVVSFATTLPELLVSIFAALDARAAEALSPGSGIGMVDMSIGNAIGSVTANLGLIMGIALVAIPMAIRRKDYMLKMILMLVAAAVTVCFSLFDNGVGQKPRAISSQTCQIQHGFFYLKPRRNNAMKLKSACSKAVILPISNPARCSIFRRQIVRQKTTPSSAA